MKRLQARATAPLLRATSLLLVLLLVLAGWFAPGSAAACAMCFNASQEAREAYYITTALMIGVPFAMAGGFAFWLRRLARAGAARVESIPVAKRA